MDLWIWLSIGAALAQTLRFMLQKQLKTAGLTNTGATYARFIYSAPLVAVLVLMYQPLSAQAWPQLSPGFWAFAMIGGLAQILATVCVVAVFSHRNFAVGITLKKSEVVITALFGFVVLGDVISWMGAVALAIGLVGVLILSDPPGGEGRFLHRIWNRAAGLGLLSGVFFAVSAVGYGGATRALVEGDLILRAGLTLAVVTASQTIAMTGWMLWRSPGEITRVLGAWRVAAPLGVASMVGSYGWFSAFAIQNVTYVFAVGQVELIFSIAVSALFFKERIAPREFLGIAVLAIGILALILFV